MTTCHIQSWSSCCWTLRHNFEKFLPDIKFVIIGFVVCEFGLPFEKYEYQLCQAMKLKDKGTGSLYKKAKAISEYFDVKGCMIILYDKDSTGGRMVNYQLTYEEIRHSLCLANYHNEKIRIENELLPKKLQ